MWLCLRNVSQSVDIVPSETRDKVLGVGHVEPDMQRFTAYV